ncbi:helix-turn-helix transcriptional regulator [Hyphomicrobium sp.]|jgi:prophage regulatory protein|uniref:helix-turn-helix transcriptional regulator n=1 Tax=Hyphomicrobium sp. TaxID=82 RepID=UPI0035672712
MTRLTADEAAALADAWQAQHEDQLRAPSADYYRDANSHDLIAMWRTERNLNGKRLTKREFGCLVERWTEVFGDPPADKGQASTVEMRDTKPEPFPADDTMLRVPDVERLTRISHTTIKRMVGDGRFPKPMRLGERAKGWPAREVREWIDRLD